MTTQEITNYIFVDNGEPTGDIAFVFGTGHSLKIAVDRAVELYQKGLVKNMIFSGGLNPITKVPEARTMFDYAVEFGVPKEDILIEDRSTNTLENVLFSLEIIGKEIGLKNIQTIVAVTKNYHARRSLMTLRKHVPQDIKLKVSNYISIKYPFTKDDWHTTEMGRDQVMREVNKIKEYLAKGDLAEL